MSSTHHEVICPCCETKLQVDIKTGEVIWQEKKAKEFGSLADMGPHQTGSSPTSTRRTSGPFSRETPS